MRIPKNSFSCIENTEHGGLHMWLSNEYGEPLIHVLGPWLNGFRTEYVVNLDEAQLKEFKRQVAEL